MYKLKKLLPIWVLLLSGCTTALDEHQGCSSEPVYIHFTTGSGFNVDVDVDVNTRSGSAYRTIGMVGFGTTTMANQKLGDFTNVNALSEGLRNSPYTMEPIAGNAGAYSVTPNEGIDPMFPYEAHAAVGIHAYSPYTEPLKYGGRSLGWYVSVDVNTDHAQTDWLYCDTLCARKDYTGEVNLNFKHLLVRLDVIINSVDGANSSDMSRSPMQRDAVCLDSCYYVKQANESVEASAKVTTRAGFAPLVVVYTDTNGKGQLLLSNGTLNGVTFDSEEYEVSTSVSDDTQTATFYLVPGTSIYRIVVDGVEYRPYRNQELIEKDKLSDKAGTLREITINHPRTDNNL